MCGPSDRDLAAQSECDVRTVRSALRSNGTECGPIGASDLRRPHVQTFVGLIEWDGSSGVVYAELPHDGSTGVVARYAFSRDDVVWT